MPLDISCSVTTFVNPFPVLVDLTLSVHPHFRTFPEDPTLSILSYCQHLQSFTLVNKGNENTLLQSSIFQALPPTLKHLNSINGVYFHFQTYSQLHLPTTLPNLVSMTYSYRDTLSEIITSLLDARRERGFCGPLSR